MTCRFSPDAARHEFTPVDNGFLTEYLPHANGLQLQVYLYGLMQCFHPAMEGSIADALGVSEQQVVETFCYWQAQGLVRIASENPLTVEYAALHALSAQSSSAPHKYGSLVAKLNTLTAPRQFGMRELRHVYDWIEIYGLDEGAVLMLVSHCMDKKGRRVSINYMSSVAESWSDEGIRSFEAAQAAVEAYSLKQHGATTILRQWNKRRRPTKDEMALYEKWTGEWGFTEEAILAALPRLTVSGSPNFTYLDELLEGMRDHALTSATEIREDDEKSAQERAFAKLLFERAGKVEPATLTQRAQIAMYLNDYAMPRELLLYAAECSRGAASNPFGMMKLLLNEWHGKGIRTVAEAEAHEAEKSSAKSKKPRIPKGMGGNADYKQRPISETDLAGILLDLNQDLGEE